MHRLKTLILLVSLVALCLGVVIKRGPGSGVSTETDPTFTAVRGDRPIDCNGAGSSAIGTCESISDGDTLTPVTQSNVHLSGGSGGGGLCADDPDDPSIIFYDSGSDCDTDDGDFHSAIRGSTPTGGGDGDPEATPITASHGWAFADVGAAGYNVDEGDDLYLETGPDDGEYDASLEFRTVIQPYHDARDPIASTDCTTETYEHAGQVCIDTDETPVETYVSLDGTNASLLGPLVDDAAGLPADNTTSGLSATTALGQLEELAAEKADEADLSDVLIEGENGVPSLTNGNPNDTNDDGTFDDPVTCSRANGDCLFLAEDTGWWAYLPTAAEWEPIAGAVDLMPGKSYTVSASVTAGDCLNLHDAVIDSTNSCGNPSTSGRSPSAGALKTFCATISSTFSGIEGADLTVVTDDGATDLATLSVPDSNTNVSSGSNTQLCTPVDHRIEAHDDYGIRIDNGSFCQDAPGSSCSAEASGGMGLIFSFSFHPEAE